MAPLPRRTRIELCVMLLSSYLCQVQESYPWGVPFVIGHLSFIAARVLMAFKRSCLYSPGLIVNPCMSKQYGTLGLTSPKQEKTLHVIDKRQAASGRICSNIFRCGFRKMLSLSRQVDFRPGARQRFSVKCHETTALRDLLGDVAGMSIGYLTHQRSHQLLE